MDWKKGELATFNTDPGIQRPSPQPENCPIKQHSDEPTGDRPGENAPETFADRQLPEIGYCPSFALQLEAEFTEPDRHPPFPKNAEKIES